MALIALILGFDREQALKRYDGGLQRRTIASFYDQSRGGSASAAPTRTASCMTRPRENMRATGSIVITAPSARLRCFYCETDIENFAIANKKTKHYDMDHGDVACRNRQA